MFVSKPKIDPNVETIAVVVRTDGLVEVKFTSICTVSLVKVKVASVVGH